MLLDVTQADAKALRQLLDTLQTLSPAAFRQLLRLRSTPPPGAAKAFVRVTSETQVDGRYPGIVLRPVESGASYSDAEECWVIDLNDIQLATGSRYEARLEDYAGSPSRPVFITDRDTIQNYKDINAHKHAGSTPFSRTYYAGVTTNTTTGNFTPAFETLYALPIYAPASSVDKLRIHVATAGGTGAKVRLGIYRATSANNLWPDELVVDAGEVAVDTTGFKEVSVDVDFDGLHLYWYVLLHNDPSPGGAAALHGQNAIDFYPIWGTDDASLSGMARCGHSTAQSFGALPATFPAAGSHTFIGDTGNIVKLGLHFSGIRPGQSGSGGALTDGDYGDITVDNSGTTMTIDDGAVDTGAIAPDAVTDPKILNDTISNAKLDGTGFLDGVI